MIGPTFLEWRDQVYKIGRFDPTTESVPEKYGDYYYFTNNENGYDVFYRMSDEDYEKSKVSHLLAVNWVEA